MGNDGKSEVPGIKLFGATITVQNSQTAKKEEEIKKDDDHGDVEMKRAEKVVACPRCKSWETKFCYFNNYNVNQPRHFCKGCQRYWTAGGALRNVPVGAGRRRAKPPPPVPTYCRGVLPSDHYDFDHWHASHAAFRQVFPVLKRRRGDSE